MNEIECTICKREFDLEGEGGSQGLFGEILVSLCPTCYSCLLDWVSQLEKEKNMKDWKTKEEMGEGFEYNEKEHKENKYNALWDIKPEEENIMRTKYLIRDVWKSKQLKELKDFLDEKIKEKKSDGYWLND